MRKPTRIKRVLDFIGLMRYEAKLDRISRVADACEDYSRTHDLRTGARVVKEEKPAKK